MTKFELLTSIIDVKKDKECVRKLLEEEISEEELQIIKSVAREGYPLSSSFKQ